MADAVVSAVLEKLTSIALDEIEKEVRRVINVRGEVNKLSSNFQAIKAVLEDAERQQLEKGKANVRDWLGKLKDVSYDIDNALDEWSTVILKSKLKLKPKVCSFVPSPSYCFSRGKLLLKTAHKIQALNERLDGIANERERYGFKVINSEKPKRDETTSFINVAEVMGRVEDKERIVNMLLNEGRIEEIGSKLQMISLVGIGGIGKTTLARLAFNNEEVKSHFEAKIWVCVSDTFNEMKIAKDILKFVIGNADKDVIEKLHKLNSDVEKMDKLRNAIVEMEKLRDTIDRLDKLEDVLRYLKTSIEGKKFLLVLDDVWTEEYGKWDQLKDLLLSNGSQGSKILVTTRKEKVAVSMGCELFKVGQLSGEEVKKVGVEFLGIEMSLSTSSSSVVAFPNLKTLTFCGMYEWEEWEEWDYGSRGEIMPCLSSLRIYGCPKLKKLPDYILQNTTLQELKISDSSDAVISNLFKKDCKPHISRISNMDVEGENEIVGHTNPIVRPSPSWTTPLTNLKNIEIWGSHVEHLPRLGKLPSLESLTVAGMREVKKVRVEFLGIEMSLSTSSSSVVAFPNLKTLEFSNLLELEEWEEWDYGSRGEIMPHLSSLTIRHCPKLKMLPNYILRNTTLEELIINYSLDAVISNLFKKDCKPHISHIPNMDVEEEKEIVGHTNPIVWPSPSWITPLTNLKNIEIWGSHVEHLPSLGKLPSLESLTMDCVWEVKKVGVEFLGIETSLSPSSSSVFAFPNLKSLTFDTMGEWEEWDYGNRGEEDITIMPRLSSLTIRYCEKLKMLPDYILQSTTLQELTISNCSIISKRCEEDYQPFIDRIPHSEVSDLDRIARLQKRQVLSNFALLSVLTLFDFVCW
ncbi:hypothetical protein SLEP1_g39311 [Rubroshorea leprosula]|uniref:Uncharacterized protein n=1 Tax=Rubroshorea leprosula TaxID=152421 RepID=A0AAV5L0I7_9ROSI|nr:hypothetical protein SLEP1_g39311 [Rubroshorea leprosula]